MVVRWTWKGNFLVLVVLRRSRKWSQRRSAKQSISAKQIKAMNQKKNNKLKYEYGKNVFLDATMLSSKTFAIKLKSRVDLR